MALGKIGSSGVAFGGRNAFSSTMSFWGTGTSRSSQFFGMKSPVRLGGYADSHVLEIDIPPGDEAPFRVTKS